MIIRQIMEHETPEFSLHLLNIAVFPRNQAGVKNRTLVEIQYTLKKKGRNTTHYLLCECEVQLQNFTYLKIALVVVWCKMVGTHKTVLGIW